MQAAIAAVHAEAPRAEETDWRQIAALYATLHATHPTPVVALNRAVAVAMAEDPARGLAILDTPAGELEGYHLFHAARADLLRRLGRFGDPRAAYRRALAQTDNEVERRFLSRRLTELSATS